MYTPETPLTYILNDVDTEARTATLRLKEEGRRNIVMRAVPISGQLAARIQMKRDNIPTNNGVPRTQYENKEFTSMLKSPSFDDNPLKLVRFIKDTGDEYIVQLVTDKGYKVFKYKNAAQRTVDKLVWLTWKAKDYIRYWEVDLTTVNK